ncbi:MAG: HAD hydrolase-like protein [Gammaproteobacteria bacterium]|jgi:4-nitrophenyl phosphatase
MNKETLERLRNAKGFVFDMDGTLVLGDKGNKGLRVLPGALEFLNLLDERGVPFMVFTNGTVRTAGQYVPVLRGLGFPMNQQRMLTPSSVAADIFVRRRFKRVLVLGVEGVWRPLQDAGIEVFLPSDPLPEDVDAVYVGWYREFGIDDLEAACQAVWRGAKLFAASLAPFYATAGGRALGTSRAISAVVTSLTGARASVVGKPSLNALRTAGRRLGVPLKELAVIGDDPALEVPMAHSGRALAVAVTSGLAGRDAFDHADTAKRPHITASGVDELLALYKN